MTNYRTTNTKILELFVACIYALVYDYIIRNFIFTTFSYMCKYSYHSMTILTMVFYVIICVLPLVFYKGFRNIASTISFFCYFLVYVPFVNTLFVADYPSSLAVPYLLLFLVAQSSFFASDAWQVGRKVFATNKTLPFPLFELICLVLMLFLVGTNINKMHMVNIFNLDEKELLYDLREINGMSSNTLNNYLIDWMNHILLPILMVCYLSAKKYLKLALAFVCMILVFMIDMQKISFLIPFVIVIFYYLYTNYKSLFKRYFQIILLAFFIVVPLFLIKNVDKSWGFSLSAILIMRTQCIASRQFAAYFDFFELRHNPYTYFSHIKIVDRITGLYPYDDSLGYTVSYGDANSNATFFLMDGIAGFGFGGCVVVAILFIILKSFLNTIGNNYDYGLCSIIMLFGISSLMNSSMFTSFITGGLFLFYIICRTVDLPFIRRQ